MKSPMIACASATVLALNSGALVSAAPAPSMWVWLSIRPGMTTLPFRSTTRVAGDAYRRISSDVPKPMNLPSFTATACAMVNALSAVMILPLTYTVSALGADSEAHALMTLKPARRLSIFNLDNTRTIACLLHGPGPSAARFDEMQRHCIVALLVSASAVACTQSITEREWSAEMTRMRSEETALRQAAETAQATLDDFLAKAGQQPVGTSAYALKVSIQQGRDTEHFWVDEIGRA